MRQIEPSKSKEKGTLKIGWMIALFLALFIIWVIYTGFQNQPETSTTMPDNMPGMYSDNVEATATSMPSNMPGMNHP